jgi:hypothetical protein
VPVKAALVMISFFDQGEVTRVLREVSAGRIQLVFLPYPIIWVMMLGIDLHSLVRHGKMGLDHGVGHPSDSCPRWKHLTH